SIFIPQAQNIRLWALWKSSRLIGVWNHVRRRWLRNGGLVRKGVAARAFCGPSRPRRFTKCEPLPESHPPGGLLEGHEFVIDTEPLALRFQLRLQAHFQRCVFDLCDHDREV